MSMLHITMGYHRPIVSHSTDTQFSETITPESANIYTGGSRGRGIFAGRTMLVFTKCEKKNHMPEFQAIRPLDLQGAIHIMLMVKF